MGLVTWSPLASGLLTGKYDAGIPEGSRLAQNEWLRKGLLSERNAERLRQFRDVAADLGCSRTQLALAWVAAQGGVSSVILGVTSLEQLRENLGALAVSITPEVALRLDTIFQPG